MPVYQLVREFDHRPVPLPDGQLFDVEAAVNAADGKLNLEFQRYPEITWALEHYDGVVRSAGNIWVLNPAVRLGILKQELPLRDPPPAPVVYHTYQLLPGVNFFSLIGATTTEPPNQAMLDVLKLLSSNYGGKLLGTFMLPGPLGNLTGVVPIVVSAGGYEDTALSGFPTLLHRTS